MSTVAFVTGASSGLGAALARRLAREGWAVGLAARRAPLLEALVAEIEREGGRALVCPCDVADREEVHGAVAYTAERLGPIELLVANAGYSERTYVDSLDAREVERLLRVNFLGAVHAVEAALPGMLERDAGHVVAMGSVAGLGPLPHTAAYSASKAALHSFFGSLRIDLRGTGVAVTVIAPGYVRTAMTARNPHSMPFLLDLDDGVERIWQAVVRRRRFASFPLPLAAASWLGRLVPAALYDRVAGLVRRDRRA